jgi:hypothetical protein
MTIYIPTDQAIEDREDRDRPEPAAEYHSQPRMAEAEDSAVPFRDCGSNI